MASGGETRICYHIDEEKTPYLVKLPVPVDRVTLGDFKDAIVFKNGATYKFFFKSYDDEFGEVKEEIVDDDAHLPSINGKVVSWLVTSEGSNASDTNSQCAESIAPDIRRPIGRPLPGGLKSLRKPLPPPDDTTTCTETESVISARRFHLPAQRDQNSRRRDPHFRMDKYSRFDAVNGKHRPGPQHYESSLMSSDLETTTFLESDEDDVSSRVTATTEHSSISRVMARQQQQRRQRRRKHKLHALSRSSSFSSITDSSLSLNIINVTLSMNQDENGPNFLGISIVGESNKGGDGGIYVGSIMKGGAVAKDGRIEPGDMILQVNDTNFENMTNDEAVRFLREVVQKPGPVKLVVAKCWDTNPKGYFTIPRTEPVRPIDPEAWVAHVAATGEYPPRPPSVSTITSTGSSLASSLPETERTVEEIILQLTVNTPLPIIIREMQKPDSGLEIRDRNWLKINIPNAFIGADVVDWLLNHVKGFVERKEARKFAAQMLKQGYIRHAVNKLTFSEQCYYVFGEIVSSMAALRIRDDDKESHLSDPCGHLPPPSTASQGCWSNPYSSSTLANGVPIYAPIPYMTGGYESNAYSYPQEQSLHSGSGGSSNDTGGSRRERQHLVRDNRSHGGPQGYSAPLEMRAIDSDSESNRSRKSAGSILMGVHGSSHPPSSLPPPPPSYANHMMMLTNQATHASTIGGDIVTKMHNQQQLPFVGPSHSGSGNNEFFVDIM